MRITRGTDVALRVLMVLAGDPARQATVASLAGELGVPPNHLAKVVLVLGRQGWLVTARGRGGGVAVTSAGREVTVRAVLAALEGEAPVVDCYDPPCPLAPPGCRLQGLLAEAHGAFLDTLGGHTIADLVRPPD